MAHFLPHPLVSILTHTRMTAHTHCLRTHDRHHYDRCCAGLSGAAAAAAGLQPEASGGGPLGQLARGGPPNHHSTVQQRKRLQRPCRTLCDLHDRASAVATGFLHNEILRPGDGGLRRPPPVTPRAGRRTPRAPPARPARWSPPRARARPRPPRTAPCDPPARLSVITASKPSLLTARGSAPTTSILKTGDFRRRARP
jgi:hypothetical protein